jgi:periplasmic glucans biosynthesis protein
LKPKGDAPVELRCFLKLGKDILTETWSYLWDPK